jgi:hypothetical protein
MLQVRALLDPQVSEVNRLALCQVLACHLEQPSTGSKQSESAGDRGQVARQADLH